MGPFLVVAASSYRARPGDDPPRVVVVIAAAGRNGSMGRIWQFVRQVVNQELASDNDERSAVSICEPAANRMSPRRSAGFEGPAPVADRLGGMGAVCRCRHYPILRAIRCAACAGCRSGKLK